jgi:hypothetical protein
MGESASDDEGVLLLVPMPLAGKRDFGSTGFSALGVSANSTRLLVD